MKETSLLLSSKAGRSGRVWRRIEGMRIPDDLMKTLNQTKEQKSRLESITDSLSPILNLMLDNLHQVSN